MVLACVGRGSLGEERGGQVGGAPWRGTGGGVGVVSLVCHRVHTVHRAYRNTVRSVPHVICNARRHDAMNAKCSRTYDTYSYDTNNISFRKQTQPGLPCRVYVCKYIYISSHS